MPASWASLLRAEERADGAFGGVDDVVAHWFIGRLQDAPSTSRLYGRAPAPSGTGFDPTHLGLAAEPELTSCAVPRSRDRAGPARPSRGSGSLARSGVITPHSPEPLGGFRRWLANPEDPKPWSPPEREPPRAPGELTPREIPLCITQLGHFGMRKPDYFDIRAFTRWCFLDRHGVLDAWPDEDCCPPTSGSRSCTLPDTMGVDLHFRADDASAEEVATYFRMRPVRQLTPSDQVRISRAQDVVRAAFALLRQNMDIVRWVACLAQHYGDLEGVNLASCIADLIEGRAPMHVTFIASFQELEEEVLVDAGAAAAAFSYEMHRTPDGSVGIIVPIEHEWWCCWAHHHSQSTPDAFCAVVAAAGNILHEIGHICADGRTNGGHQDPPRFRGSPSDPDYTFHKALHAWIEPCGDEVRMLESAFYWAMDQRFACLHEPGSCCASMGNASNFLNSWKIAPWGCTCQGVVCP